MSIEIVVKPKGSVFEATAYDGSGVELASLIAFSESNARRLLKIKMGFEVKKPKKKKEKCRSSTIMDSRSVMSGLQGVTSSRPWEVSK